MTIEFTNKLSESLQPKIYQLIYTGSKFSPKLSTLLEKVLNEGNIFVQESPSGALAEESDWNNISRTIRLESNDSSLLNFLYQLSKAGNYHFKYIKSPIDFFSAKEYACYVEEIHFVSNSVFCEVLAELKPHCSELNLPNELLQHKLELYRKTNKRDFLDSMIQQCSRNDNLSHADIYCAQWDKFMIVEKIKKINEMLIATSIDSQDNKSVGLSQNELQGLLDTLYELCTRLEFMDFLSDYPIPDTLKPDLLSEADSLQPAIQLKATLDEMIANIERLRKLLPEKASTGPVSASISQSSELNSARMRLEKFAINTLTEHFHTTKRQYLVTRDLSKSRDESLNLSPNKILTTGFEFDNPSQLTVIERDYRAEFINSLSTDDDLLREFQIAYFDDLLTNYRINCIKATEGKSDFVKDSQDEVVDLNLLTRQIIPKIKLKLK